MRQDNPHPTARRNPCQKSPRHAACNFRTPCLRDRCLIPLPPHHDLNMQREPSQPVATIGRVWKAHTWTREVPQRDSSKGRLLSFKVSHADSGSSTSREEWFPSSPIKWLDGSVKEYLNAQEREGTKITPWYTLRILGGEETRRLKERWMKKSIRSCSR